VRLGYVFAAHLEAVVHRRCEASPIAGQAGVNTGLHLRLDHGFSPVPSRQAYGSTQWPALRSRQAPQRPGLVRLLSFVGADQVGFLDDMLAGFLP
jgi:hypothetical protein